MVQGLRAPRPDSAQQPPAGGEGGGGPGGGPPALALGQAWGRGRQALQRPAEGRVHRAARGRGWQADLAVPGLEGQECGSLRVTITRWGPRRDWAGSSGHFGASTPGKNPSVPLLTYRLRAGGREPLCATWLGLGPAPAPVTPVPAGVGVGRHCGRRAARLHGEGPRSRGRGTRCSRGPKFGGVRSRTGVPSRPVS